MRRTKTIIAVATAVLFAAGLTVTVTAKAAESPAAARACETKNGWNYGFDYKLWAVQVTVDICDGEITRAESTVTPAPGNPDPAVPAVVNDYADELDARTVEFNGDPNIINEPPSTPIPPGWGSSVLKNYLTSLENAVGPIWQP